MGAPEVVMNNDMEVSIQNKAYEFLIFSDPKDTRPSLLTCWAWQWVVRALQQTRSRVSRMQMPPRPASTKDSTIPHLRLPIVLKHRVLM